MGGTLGVLGRVVVVVVGVVGAAGVAAGQSPWTATRLTPMNPAVAASAAFGTAGGQQVGVVFNGASPTTARPVIWNNTPNVWTDLTPSTGTGGYVYATDGVQQGGEVRLPLPNFPSRSVPSVWTGTSASWVNLLPPQFPNSAGRVYGVSGGQQAGALGILPSVWSGTGASWTNLLPAGYENGEARAVHSGRQVGFVRPSESGLARASLWSGLAESWVDLTPAGASDAMALGIYGDWQVGYVNARPALWSGTAESWVDLSPQPNVGGLATAIFGSFQVGKVFGAEVSERASLWSGTAGSWEDLSLALPAGQWTRSEATGVWADSTTIYVSGFAYATDLLNTPYAFLWTRPIPGPGSLAALALAGVVATRRRR